MRKEITDERLKSLFLIIGENIKRLRGGISQNELASKAGISRQTLDAIEKGKSIRFINLIKIADALDIPPATLFLSDFDRGEMDYRTKVIVDQVYNALGMNKKTS